jgi:hypothetical protein
MPASWTRSESKKSGSLKGIVCATKVGVVNRLMRVGDAVGPAEEIAAGQEQGE